MSRILSLALLSFCLVLCSIARPSSSEQIPLVPSQVQSSSAWSWYSCGDENDLVDVQTITISPNPPKPGQDLTVTATGYVSETIKTGAYVNVSVKLGIIKLLTKKFDICEEAKNANASIQCPVEEEQYTVVQTVALPAEIPPAKFSVEADAYNFDGAPLTCIHIDINFMSSTLTGLFGQAI
ncbi:ML domain-containing protein [Hysterangium stoloniferum]|nr:ML domain-containing protein [Hysterangium stoloniferum]